MKRLLNITPAAKYLLVFIFVFLVHIKQNAQSVGVVLSGGGASGMAHVGFLKALEENNIPIDYIVGTSSGALVASLYASGYSPHEIDSLLISEKFLLMANGEIEDEHKFFFKSDMQDASLINIDFSKNFKTESFLPTNYIFPNLLDFELINLLSKKNPLNCSFDSLFVPFRCLASDVSNNKPIIFKSGNLNEAVRASMTYPFYMKPIKVDGRYMYDGGIYNNFPSDILYHDFMPDVIIGCNLSDTIVYEDEDFLSQLKNIILERSSDEIQCENGIVISPKTSVGTFDFENAPYAMKDGYAATLQMMDSIKKLIERKELHPSITDKRKKYNAWNKNEIIIDSIAFKGKISSKKALFIKKSLIDKKQINYSELKKNYFRLLEDPNILHIFPTIKHNPKTNNYILVLDVTFNKELTASFGGIYSSSPINTGFIGLKFRSLTRTSNQLTFNSYFGKLYGSVYGDYRIDLPSSKFPIGFSINAGINRWDFFKSYATFFEEVKPSFIVYNEYHYGASIHLPLTNSTNFDLSYTNFYNTSNYYQTEEFTVADTTDFVRFLGHNFNSTLTKSSHNDRLFPTLGTLLQADFDYTLGNERFISGSTSLIKIEDNNQFDWVKLKFIYDKYFKLHSKLSIGIYFNAVLSSNYQFSNYFSTLIFSSQFQPIEQLRVIYSEKFRSNNYLGIGLKQIFLIRPKLQLRNEAYLYSAIVDIRSGTNNQPITLSKNFLSYFPIIKSSLVFTTPIGPLGFSASYIYPEEKSLLLQLNFGYIIQNKKILD
ncbi:MAG: patatin-like phospholipase family protein [Bacteroidia bacterium]